MLCRGPGAALHHARRAERDGEGACAEQGGGGSGPAYDLGQPRSSLSDAAFEAFTTKWIVTEERAVRCLAEKIERCLTFYDFPEEDWSTIRTNNVAERAFRFVRQRQRPMGAFTNEESAERIFGALGSEWNRRRSHPLEAIYTT
jgi:transposase-like protein